MRRCLATGAALLAALLVLPAAAAPVLVDVSGTGGLFDKVLLVQPIHVCNSDASLCGPTAAHHPGVTIATLAQAHIATALLPMRSHVSDTMVQMHMPAEEGLLNKPGAGQSSNVQTLNAWFVHDIAFDKDNGSLGHALGMVAGFPQPQGSTTPNGVLLRRLGERKAITFAHELSHALGAQHVADPDNLMAEGLASNFKPHLTPEQIAFMRTSGFLAAVPQIQLTTRIGASFTELRIDYLATPGAAEVSLRELNIDLADYLNTQGGPGQRPATERANARVVDDSTLTGAYTLSYRENMVTEWPCGSCEEDPQTSSTNGLPELGIHFGDAGLAPGQFITLRLGITTNLRNEYEYTSSRSLADAAVDLHFDHGLSARSLLAELAPESIARGALSAGADDEALMSRVFDLRHFSGIYTEGRYGNPFGEQYAPGSVALATGAWQPDFVADASDDGNTPGGGSVPLPGSAALTLAALFALSALRLLGLRRRFERHRVRAMRALKTALATGAVAASGAAAAAPVLTHVANAGGVFDKVLLVQPIQVCRDDGSGCAAQAAAFPGNTIVTLAQANIATGFLPWRTLHNTERWNLSSPTLEKLQKPDLGQSSNHQTINAWFVRNILVNYENPVGMGLVPPVQGATDVNGVFVASPRALSAPLSIALAHEIGHNLGLLDLVGPNANTFNLMAGVSEDGNMLTPEQIAFMRQSGFLAAVPQIRLATRTVFDGDVSGAWTELRIEYLPTPGSADVALRELSIDLEDLIGQQGDPAQRPATAATVLQVVEESVASDVTVRYAENMITNWVCRSCDEEDSASSTGGLPELMLDFGDSGLRPGEAITLRLGISTNLRNEYTYLSSRSLAGGAVDLHFDHGLSAQSLLLVDDGPAAFTRTAMVEAADGAAADAWQLFDLRRLTGIYDEGRYANPFGEQYAPGTAAPNTRGTLVINNHDHGGGSVPLPPSGLLLLAGVALLARSKRGRPRR